MRELSTTTSLIRDGVNRRIEAVLQAQSTRYAHLSPGSTELAQVAAALTRGGKRVRSVLAGLGAGLRLDEASRYACLTSPELIRTGAALELYQASALVHDDIIDAALTRRAQAAAQQQFAALHRTNSWCTDPHTFGVNSAILLGDLLFSFAQEELHAALASSSLNNEQVLAVTQAFATMTSEVALGQYLDLRSEVLPLPPSDQDVQSYAAQMHSAALQVIRYKSARYSVMYPLLIGALMSGIKTNAPLYAQLKIFGEELGIVFQLRDDVLGVFGDCALTGKPVGDDLREGKRTVLLALTWELTDKNGRDLLRTILTGIDTSTQAIAQTSNLIKSCGALKMHEEEITAHLHLALQALDKIPQTQLSDASREELRQFAQQLGSRCA